MPNVVGVEQVAKADLPKAEVVEPLPNADGCAGAEPKLVDPNAGAVEVTPPPNAGAVSVFDEPKAEDGLGVAILFVPNADVVGGAELPNADVLPNAPPVATGVVFDPNADGWPNAEVVVAPEGWPNADAVPAPLPNAEVVRNADPACFAAPNAPALPPTKPLGWPNAPAPPTAARPDRACCCCCNRFFRSSLFLSACLSAFPGLLATSLNAASASCISFCSCCTYCASWPLALAWYAMTRNSSGLTSFPLIKFGSPLAGAYALSFHSGRPCGPRSSTIEAAESDTSGKLESPY